MHNNKVWYVTGASQGLGLTLVRQLLAAGYRVAATSRSAADLQKAAEDHSTPMVYAKIDPSLDALRGNADFQQIVRQMKF